ncbi:MAG: winged helix-turn-helix domain-containing protein [bacterium]|nr:winged helix-turn-helix domain-containing protein [bacterium]
MKNTYGVKYSKSGMTEWLHRDGFSYKKPQEKPAKADIQKQNEFIKFYEELKKILEKMILYFLEMVYILQWQLK